MSILSSLSDWLDDRTGYRASMEEALYEEIPGGSRWIYVTGSMLVFAFITQVITGIFLWMSYSAGSQNAWESVYFIQNELQGGWLLRGVHHYMAQAMVLILPFHMLQVILCKAYVAPREVNYWLGLILMLIVLGLGLTGYLLPWDQKGYWATKVATELMSLPPGGGYIQKLVVGGTEYGHLTLTRFFALHAGVLPALLVIVLALHVAMFRKHGITAHSSSKREDEYFWPKQVFKDAAACAVMMAAVVAIVFYRGTELGPPAEPTESYGAARPEWYFLFLFQLLKKFHSEFVGAIVVPSAVLGFLFLMPLIARVRYLHYVNVLVMFALIGTAGYLTYEAIDHDNYHTTHPEAPADPKEAELWAERVAAAEAFHEAKEDAHREYERVRELVEFYGIGREGVTASLVAKDPEIQGPRIFKRACASCHSYLDELGEGIAGPSAPEGWDGRTPYGAPNLYGFGEEAKVAGFLDPQQVANQHFFGTSVHGLKDDDDAYESGGMVEFVMDNITDVNDEEVQAIIATLSAEANLVRQPDVDPGTIERGKTAMVDSYACTDCHKFHDEGDLGSAPDLTGYGSYQWLYDFIANPNHERFYADGNNDRMPAFGEFPDDPQRNLLTPQQIDLLVRWIRQDDKVLTSGNAPPSSAAVEDAEVSDEESAAASGN